MNRERKGYGSTTVPSRSESAAFEGEVNLADVGINALGFKGYDLWMTVNSRASERVLLDMLIRDTLTVPSEGSMEGVGYVAANGSSTPNGGEMAVKKVTEKTLQCLPDMHVPNVTTSLMSVTRIGHVVSSRTRARAPCLCVESEKHVDVDVLRVAGAACRRPPRRSGTRTSPSSSAAGAWSSGRRGRCASRSPPPPPGRRPAIRSRYRGRPRESCLEAAGVSRWSFYCRSVWARSYAPQ